MSGALNTGVFADPNGNVTPDDTSKGAYYYQDPALSQFNWWLWSVSAQAWIQVSAP